MKPTDLVIPVAEKDYNKLPYVIEAARKHLDVETIHVIAPSPEMIEDKGVVLHRDDDVLPYDRNEVVNYRPSWVFQQMLKVFQDVTENDWFLVIDADIVIDQPLPLWTDKGKPILYLGRDQLHAPYFAFNERVLGFGKVYDYSFLSECTLYSKSLVREMLAFCNLTLDEFWAKVCEITHLGCKPADSELYGSYIVHEHPDLYEIRKIKATLGGRYAAHIWTDAEIQAEISSARCRCPGVHLISLHSWEGGI